MSVLRPTQLANKLGCTLLLVLSLVLLFWSATTHASERSLRCPNGLITIGDSRTQVERRCGEPEDVQFSREFRERRQPPRAAPRRQAPDLLHPELDTGRFWVEVERESWHFDFGPRRFMRVVHFIDGRVSRIETLGYGNP